MIPRAVTVVGADLISILSWLVLRVEKTDNVVNYHVLIGHRNRLVVILSTSREVKKSY